MNLVKAGDCVYLMRASELVAECLSMPVLGGG